MMQDEELRWAAEADSIDRQQGQKRFSVGQQEADLLSLSDALFSKHLSRLAGSSLINAYSGAITRDPEQPLSTIAQTVKQDIRFQQDAIYLSELVAKRHAVQPNTVLDENAVYGLNVMSRYSDPVLRDSLVIAGIKFADRDGSVTSEQNLVDRYLSESVDVGKAPSPLTSYGYELDEIGEICANQAGWEEYRKERLAENSVEVDPESETEPKRADLGVDDDTEFSTISLGPGFEIKTPIAGLVNNDRSETEVKPVFSDPTPSVDATAKPSQFLSAMEQFNEQMREVGMRNESLMSGDARSRAAEAVEAAKRGARVSEGDLEDLDSKTKAKVRNDKQTKDAAQRQQPVKLSRADRKVARVMMDREDRELHKDALDAHGGLREAGDIDVSEHEVHEALAAGFKDGLVTGIHNGRVENKAKKTVDQVKAAATVDDAVVTESVAKAPVKTQTTGIQMIGAGSEPKVKTRIKTNGGLEL